MFQNINKKNLYKVLEASRPDVGDLFRVERQQSSQSWCFLECRFKIWEISQYQLCY